MKMNNRAEPLACRECDTEVWQDGSSGRREFLQATASFGIAVALLAITSDTAESLPVFMTQGVQNGAEIRYPVPPTDSVNVDRTAQVIVARSQGHLYVFALSCPHQNNAVKWVPKDHRFQCTKHDSRYQPDGVHTSGRATRNMDRYAIRRDGDAVVVDLHRWFQSDKDPAGWAAAALAV